MNIYLLNQIGKFICTFLLCILNLFGIEVTEEKFEIINDNISKNSVQEVELIDYEVDYVYNNKVPYNKENVLIEGTKKVVYKNEQGEIIVLREGNNALVEQGLGYYGIYYGRLTAYGPDCVGCSPTGNVACKTIDQKTFSLINDGIYYEDKEYGTVRILAATRMVFPCGTIIKVSNEKIDEFYGIVLDTGGSMIDAWNNNNYIWMDLAFNNESEANMANVTSSNTTYNVERWGW